MLGLMGFGLVDDILYYVGWFRFGRLVGSEWLEEIITDKTNKKA
jgi:hypothetical protein